MFMLICSISCNKAVDGFQVTTNSGILSGSTTIDGAIGTGGWMIPDSACSNGKKQIGTNNAPVHWIGNLQKGDSISVDAYKGWIFFNSMPTYQYYYLSGFGWVEYPPRSSRISAVGSCN